VKHKREKERDRVKESELTIDRNLEGAWRITAIVGGYYVTRVFYGYTKKESVALFREYAKLGKL
jgi:hypothetical protein